MTTIYAGKPTRIITLKVDNYRLSIWYSSWGVIIKGERQLLLILKLMQITITKYDKY